MRIDRLPPGAVHAIGAAGLETATMVRYLVECGRDGIVLHDEAHDFEAAFRQAHRFQPRAHVERSWRAVDRSTSRRRGADYLAGIEEAAAILVPCSLMLRPERHRLAALADRIVRYPDACFDLFAGGVIGITGSYGKTTTCRFAGALVDGVVCGNDREFLFDLAELAAAEPDQLMVFETSNRHLAGGFRRVLDVGVVTGITRNHEPDHGSFEAYRAAKYRMAERCRALLYHESIPRSFDDAGALVDHGMSYGSTGAWRLEGARVAGPDGIGAPLPGVDGLSAPNQQNALAAAAAALLAGVDADVVAERSNGLAAQLPHYRQAVSRRLGRTIVNDAASCMPAATAPLVASLDEPFVLLCGGDRQRYTAGEFDQLAQAVAANPHARAVVVLPGPMARHLGAALADARCAFVTVDSITAAVERALAVDDAAIVFSPACGTGTLFLDKYERGEQFDAAIDRLVPAGQATG
ncbi:MAG: Mur ligase family protein [Ilumatobacteraceae bacterium]